MATATARTVQYLLSLRNYNDSIHDGFKSNKNISDTLPLKCQGVKSHYNENEMLNEIGIDNSGGLLIGIVDTDVTNQYTIYNSQTKVGDDISKNLTNALVQPTLNFVVDFLFAKPFANIITTLKAKDLTLNYIYNLPVAYDPALKILPRSNGGKTIGLTDSRMNFIDEIKDFDGVIEISSGNKLFNCSLSSNLNINDESPYNLFGSSYKLLMGKGKKRHGYNEAYCIIIDEINNKYTFADKSFAGKNSGILSQTIQSVRNFFLIKLIPTFKDIRSHIKNIRKGKINSPEHIVAKRAGDALQVLSCLNIGDEAVFVTHDKLAVWLALYVGVKNVIYMNRKSILKGMKLTKYNNITYFKHTTLETYDTKVVNLNKIISKYSSNPSYSEIYTEMSAIWIKYHKYISDIKTKIKAYSNVNIKYRGMLNLFQQALPIVKFFNGLKESTTSESAKLEDDKIVDAAEVVDAEKEDYDSDGDVAMASLTAPQKAHLNAMQRYIDLLVKRSSANNTSKEMEKISTIIPTSLTDFTKFTNIKIYQPIKHKKSLVIRRSYRQRLMYRIFRSNFYKKTKFDIILEMWETDEKKIFRKIIKKFVRNKSFLDNNPYYKKFTDAMKTLIKNKRAESSVGTGAGTAASGGMRGGRSPSPLLSGSPPSIKSSLSDSDPSLEPISPSTIKDDVSKLYDVIKAVVPEQVLPEDDTSLQIKTKFGGTYIPGENEYLDDICVRNIYYIISVLASFDDSVIDKLDKKMNIKELLTDDFIQKILNLLLRFNGINSSTRTSYPTLKGGGNGSSLPAASGAGSAHDAGSAYDVGAAADNEIIINYPYNQDFQMFNDEIDLLDKLLNIDIGDEEVLNEILGNYLDISGEPVLAKKIKDITDKIPLETEDDDEVPDYELIEQDANKLVALLNVVKGCVENPLDCRSILSYTQLDGITNFKEIMNDIVLPNCKNTETGKYDNTQIRRYVLDMITNEYSALYDEFNNDYGKAYIIRYSLKEMMVKKLTFSKADAEVAAGAVGAVGAVGAAKRKAKTDLESPLLKTKKPRLTKAEGEAAAEAALLNLRKALFGYSHGGGARKTRKRKRNNKHKRTRRKQSTKKGKKRITRRKYRKKNKNRRSKKQIHRKK